MHTATPTKLKSGTWGARVQVNGRAVSEGDAVQITTRAGKSWQAAIGRIYWRGEGVVIAATRSLDRPQTSRSSRYERDCEDCLSVGPCGPNCEYAHIFAR